MSKKIFLILYLLFFIIMAGSANAAYYGVYDIGGGGSSVPLQWPSTDHFDWINRTYTYNSSGDTFSINVIMYAPDNWDDSGNPGDSSGVEYNNYQVEDDSYSVVSWESTPESFNDVYSYFYQIENQSTTSISSLTIPYDPALVSGYGYIDDGYGYDPTGMSTSSSELTVTFDGLSNTESSEWFFMTSEYWWGWQSLTYNGGSSATGSTTINSSYSSPDGKIPAPNPEAPTVALYIVGLFGMLCITRMKLRERLS